MLIALGFYPGDLHQAQHLAGWLKEIGPFPGHRLLIARDVRTPLNPFKDVGFDSVEEIVISDDIWNRWPQSANNVFRKLATHIELVDKAPYWLMCEPDVVLMDQSGFNLLERDHVDSGKPFSLDLVSVEGVEIHGSGVGIYPGKLTHFAGEAKLAMEMAWDMAGKDQIVPAMHVSPYILHAWKHPTFENWAAVEREIFAFKPECVLFHASKDGSLINLLRERRRQPTSAQSISMRTQTTSILIKSYPPDYQLLKYSLQSIEKYARGFEEVILVVPEDHIPHEVSEVSLGNLLNIIALKEEEPGYAFQQAIKANAHVLTNSEYIAHIDSDTAFTCPVDPGIFFREGKPIWFITPYDQTSVPWRSATEAFIGHPVQFEFMRRLPMFVPRKVHEKMAKFCLQKHGMNLHQYIMGAEHFSEFNALGAIAYEFFRDEIHWFDTSAHPEAEWPPLVALQTWSHAPLEENKATLDQAISGVEMERPLVGEPSVTAPDGQGEPAAAAQPRDIEHPRQTPPILPVPVLAEPSRGDDEARESTKPVVAELAAADSRGGQNPLSSAEIIEAVRQGTVDRKALAKGLIVDKSKTFIIPWADQAESEAEIKRLCRELRKFQTSPRWIDRVRKELACFQVITGDKAIKGMIKRRHRLGPDYDPMNPATLTKKQRAAIENLEKAREKRINL